MSPIAVGVGLLPLGVGDAPPAALDLAGVVAQVLTPPLIVAEYIDDWGRGLWGSCGGEGVHHEFWTSEGSKNITTEEGAMLYGDREESRSPTTITWEEKA